jgi:hypothetical protein
MAPLDFPSSPNVGDLYPVSPGPGMDEFVVMLPHEERVIDVRAEPREIAVPGESRLIEVKDDAAGQ